MRLGVGAEERVERMVKFKMADETLTLGSQKAGFVTHGKLFPVDVYKKFLTLVDIP